MAVPVSTGNGLSVRPSNAIAPRGAFCSANTTWNSGVRPRSRSGCNASTNHSKGASWCAYAPSVVSRTRATRVVNAGSPDRSVRSASVLTNKPIRPSISARPRPAMGVPTTRSAWPVWRSSSVLKAASKTMKSVAPSRRASACRASAVVCGSVKRSVSPLRLSTDGRGLSAGSSSGGAAARRSRQYANGPSVASLSSRLRCQAA